MVFCVQNRIEYTTLVRYFFGERAFFLANVWLYLSLQTVNIASIAVCGQTADMTILTIFKKTCAVQVCATTPI